MTKIIEISVSDENFDRMVNALSSHFGYSVEALDENGIIIPNSQGRTEFLEIALAKWLLDIARDTEINESVRGARQALEENIRSLRDAAKLMADGLEVSVTIK